MLRLPTKQQLEYVGALIVIAGVPLFFFERWQHVADEKRARALELVQRFQAADMADARFRLLQPWLTYKDELRGLAQMGGIDREEADRLVLSIFEASEEKPDGFGLLEPLSQITDFFDQASICIEEELCDVEVMQSYFANYSVQFFCLYGAVIEKQRIDLSMPDYGFGVETLVRTWGGCPSS